MKEINRIRILSAFRLLLVIGMAAVIATLINADIFADFKQQRLLRIHTADLKTLAEQMTIKLSYFMERGDQLLVQQIIDADFGLFGYVVTDCKATSMACPEQQILFVSGPRSGWYRQPTKSDLARESFTVLRHLPDPGTGGGGEIIGRLYVLKNIPLSFAEDYRLWLSAPSRKVGVHSYYLRTMGAFLSGGTLVWLLVELLFRNIRQRRIALRQREAEIISRADGYLRQLKERNQQLEDTERQMREQSELSVRRIRVLEQRVRDDEEYSRLAEEIIAELEDKAARQSLKYTDELERTRQEIEQLEQRVVRFEAAPKQAKEESYKALVDVVSPQFSNSFEQLIHEAISASSHFARDEWRLLRNFDVAVGRNFRQFTDFILVSRNCVVILEAKYYLGRIVSDGDILNDVWYSRSGSDRKKIDCLWGENPYHQLNEYCMSLMKLIKQRSPWELPVYGVIVFPDEADTTGLGEHLGRFYRIARLLQMVPLLERLQAEARRHQGGTKRPSTLQVEHMLKGRKVP
ncbi:NERD domain-containing protein [Geobacter argillaceus]|uniref:Nuclease-like protein n=1 Tax=Geobacter argillaceus TaxID=345631 RepID=A0A562VNV7_9BACT|nr:NERD domain-containing protein [Geobacter argillaceus]TWJ19673.1 nuclease-like protein [Geobacter argillaceus]